MSLGRTLRSAEAVLFDAAGTLFSMSPDIPTRIHDAAAEGGEAIDLVDLRKAYSRASELRVWPEDQKDPAHRLAAWAKFTTVLLGLAGATPRDQSLAVTVAAQVCEPSSYKLFDDVPPLLEALVSLKYPIQVISNFDSLLLDILRATGLSSYFPSPIFSGSTGVYKPDPLMFRLGAASVGLVPSRCVYIGDSLRIDFQAAQDAGMAAVLIDRSASNSPGLLRVKSLDEVTTELKSEISAK